jgi:ribonuclease HI
MPNTPTFLDNLPSWQQSLLDQLTTEHSHREILEMLQTSTKPPIIATDGSVKPYRAQGTFAWVLADQDGDPWLRCRGPVSGTPIDSFRSEAQALLSVLVYLNLLADYFKAPVSTIKSGIYTDSESNVKRIIQNRHRKQPEFPNETLSPSWDLHQAIHRELTNLPNVTIHYIKAHQDRTTSNAELSKEAKLNIESDILAEEAYSSSTFSDQVPIIAGVSAQLSIDGKTIVSKHRVIARDIRRTKAIKLRIQEQTGMTDQALAEVDWDSHTMAVGPSQLSQPFLVKMLHQILPVGMLIHRYDPVKYTIDCPTCREHSETYDHLFRCCHPSRAGWKLQLKATLVKFTDETKSHHLLQDILVTGIHNWLKGLPFPTNQYPPDWHELIDSQSQIGWKQLLLGRFSVKWLEYQ